MGFKPATFELQSIDSTNWANYVGILLVVDKFVLIVNHNTPFVHYSMMYINKTQQLTIIGFGFRKTGGNHKMGMMFYFGHNCLNISAFLITVTYIISILSSVFQCIASEKKCLTIRLCKVKILFNRPNDYYGLSSIWP